MSSTPNAHRFQGAGMIAIIVAIIIIIIGLVKGWYKSTAEFWQKFTFYGAGIGLLIIGIAMGGLGWYSSHKAAQIEKKSPPPPSGPTPINVPIQFSPVSQPPPPIPH